MTAFGDRPAVRDCLEAACWFAGGLYGGVQEHQDRRWLVVTEPDTRSTGYVPIDESFTTSAVRAKMQEIRRQYDLQENTT